MYTVPKFNETVLTCDALWCFLLLYIKKMMVQRLILLLTNGFQPAAWNTGTECKNSGFAVKLVGWHNSTITSCEFGQITCLIYATVSSFVHELTRLSGLAHKALRIMSGMKEILS